MWGGHVKGRLNTPDFALCEIPAHVVARFPASSRPEDVADRPTWAGAEEGEQTLMSNTTTLAGNLTRDPEIRYTREGQANATFGLAVNRRWQPKGSDEWEEATSFFDVVCWRELAENVALSLVKGSRVMVTGRLEQHTWETELGERRSRIEVTAEDVGPSLRFATVEITRTERRVGGEAASIGESDSAIDVQV
jgi:single-strand DNA-binding protein